MNPSSQPEGSALGWRGRSGRNGRRSRLALLVLVVAAAHLWLSSQLLAQSFGFGAGPDRVARMDVNFVQSLQQAAPPAVPPKPAAQAQAATKTKAVVAQQAASAARTAASAPGRGGKPDEPPALALLAPPEAPAQPQQPEPPPTPAAPPPPVPLPEPTSAAPATASLGAANADGATAQAALPSTGERVSSPSANSLPSAAAAPAAQAEAFEWPPSTRLTYTLEGNYRGPVQGQAKVEWLLQGGRYQVHLDASVGPSFAPLVTRRLSSDGLISGQGLSPLRYEEVTTVPLRGPRRSVVEFGREAIKLANGNEVAKPTGVQDSASQFVQMTWLFTTQPQLLAPGQQLVLPLALPGRVEPWTYEVKAAPPLQTPIGEVPTVHVQPRRGAKPGDLTVEFWVAPSLQNLPVRILIRQDEQNFIDLVLDRLPQQALRAPKT